MTALTQTELCKAPAGTYDGLAGGRPYCPVPCPHEPAIMVGAPCVVEEPHEAHFYRYVTPDGSLEDRACPGVRNDHRLFDIWNDADHRWLEDYFTGYLGLQKYRHDKEVLIARCRLLQSRVTAHHRRDHVTQKWCAVCPNDPT